tara:strand:- start:1167 stop:1448 length:282 start_codon:yes stop_codon:yes gene_type:complete
MTNKKEIDHYVRFEVASERRTISEYSLIPESDPAAKEQHISEHQMLQDIQRLAQTGDSAGVKDLLLKFPESKREDLRTMLQKSVSEKGKILEF